MRDPHERAALVNVESLAVTWGGHATALIELDGMRLLTDPLLEDRVGPLQRVATPVDRELSGRIDAVLLSHLHADHADLRSLRRLGAATVVFAPRGAGAWLARHGVSNVEELSPGEQATLGDLRITATPAQHARRRWPLGVEAEPLGFIAAGSQALYFAGDTDLFAGMSELLGAHRRRAAADRRVGANAGAGAPGPGAGRPGRRADRGAARRADPLGHVRARLADAAKARSAPAGRAVLGADGASATGGRGSRPGPRRAHRGGRWTLE